MSHAHKLHRGKSKTTKDKTGVKSQRNFNHSVTEYSRKDKGPSQDPCAEPVDADRLGALDRSHEVEPDYGRE
jgi:hypothetical protein